MSEKSEAVKKWRKETKKRMIESMGGKCSICNYNKCHDALEFHHIDPNVKEIGLGSIRANPTSWSKIVDELKKCILLCSNCHREIHDGITKIPENYPKFNEKYFNYKELNKDIGTPCKKCGKIKPSEYKFCSSSCSSSARERVDWSKYDLIKMKETMNNSQIADLIGVSDVTIRKRYLKLKVAPVSGNAPDKLVLTGQPVRLLGSTG